MQYSRAPGPAAPTARACRAHLHMMAAQQQLTCEQPPCLISSHTTNTRHMCCKARRVVASPSTHHALNRQLPASKSASAATHMRSPPLSAPAAPSGRGQQSTAHRSACHPCPQRAAAAPPSARWSHPASTHPPDSSQASSRAVHTPHEVSRDGRDLK